MRRPHGTLGLTIAFLLAGLMSACGNTEETPRARVEFTWGPVERVTGPWGNRQATTMAPDGTTTVIWIGARGAISREAPPGKPWAPDESLPGSATSGNLIAGVDGEGTVTVVWDQQDGDRYSFWSAQHPAGGRWAQPARLGDTPVGDIGWQGWDLAVSPSGAAVFAWVPESGPVRAVYRDADRAWAPPASLPGYPLWASVPNVTIDADGLASVAYLRNNPGLLTLVQGSSAGWQAPVELEAAVGMKPFDLDAASRGEVVVVWQQADRRTLTGRLIDGDLKEQHSITAAGEKYMDVQVAASSDGSARFVWHLADPDAPGGEQANGDPPLPGADDNVPREVRSLVQTADASLGDIELIGPISDCDAQVVFGVAMAGNDRGDTMLAWSGEDASGLDVAYLSEGAKEWSPQADVVPDGSGPFCYATPQVALAENGSAVVTWQNYHSNSQQGEATELLARRLTVNR